MLARPGCFGQGKRRRGTSTSATAIADFVHQAHTPPPSKRTPTAPGYAEAEQTVGVDGVPNVAQHAHCAATCTVISLMSCSDQNVSMLPRREDLVH